MYTEDRQLAIVQGIYIEDSMFKVAAEHGMVTWAYVPAESSRHRTEEARNQPNPM
jgi:hypothetical protein